MDKYYLFLVNNKKAILLSSSNSKSKLRDEALDKIGDKIKKYDGLYLYRVKIMKVSKKDKEEEKSSKIKFIGGPMVAHIEKIQINLTSNNKVKLKSVDEKGDKIYFSDRFLIEHDDKIPIKTIQKMVYDYVHNKFNQGLFAINIIND